MATPVQVAQSRANQSRQRFEERLEGFDPAAAAATTAGGIFEGLEEDFLQLMSGHRAGLNARGIRSDLGGARLRRGFQDVLARNIAQLGLQSSALELQRIGAFGSLFAQDLNLLTTERELEVAQEQAEREERSSLIGAALGFGGRVLGGPIGGKVGDAVAGFFD